MLVLLELRAELAHDLDRVDVVEDRLLLLVQLDLHEAHEQLLHHRACHELT